MESKLISTAKPLAIDSKIADWVASQPPKRRSGSKSEFGIRSDSGPVYRTLQVWGNDEPEKLWQFLSSELGLFDEIDAGGWDERFVAIFSTTRQPPKPPPDWAEVRPINWGDDSN